MYDIVSQVFIECFLIAYSVFLITLAWWALSARLKPAVKNGDASRSNEVSFGSGRSRRDSVYVRNAIRR